MFFGRRKLEEVKADELDQFIDIQFEKKLGRFKSRSHVITNSLNQTILRFKDACDRFEELNAEPYIENPYFTNISSIKTQKGPYARSLKHILGGTSLAAEDTSNSYDRYKRILSDLEGMIKKILGTNSSFKTVLYCYSNQLGEFKSRFSEIQRYTGALKDELDNRADDFSEYSTVVEHVSRLHSCDEELEALGKSVDKSKTDAKWDGVSASDSNETGISMKLADKKAELTRLDKEKANLHNEINSLILPLERASKKLDHLSVGKVKLHTFIENPINAINNESDYSKFRMLVKELEENMRKGAIDLKNIGNVSEAVSTLLDSDIYPLINLFKSIQQKESEVSREVGALERDLNEIKKARAASEEYAQEIAEMGAKIDEAKRSNVVEKSIIEKLCLDHYGVLISIID